MATSASKEPKFKVGDLVVMFWKDFVDGTVLDDDPQTNVVIGVRVDVMGPAYTLLRPDGSTRVRFEFELKALECKEPMHNVTQNQ